MPHIALLVVFLTTGCLEGTIYSRPELALTAKSSGFLIQPIRVAVVDEEADKRGGEYASTLIDEICSAYPTFFKAVPSSSIPADGRVSMRITILQLGAFFERSRNAILNDSTSSLGTVGDLNDWSDVVDGAKSAEPVVSGYAKTFYGAHPHGWRGIVDIQIEMFDHRSGRSTEFVLPLAAERGTGNSFGYATGAAIFDDAWRIVNPRLQKFLSGTVNKIEAEALPKNQAPPSSFSCAGSISVSS